MTRPAPPRAAARAAVAAHRLLQRAADRVLPAELALVVRTFGTAQTQVIAAIAELGVVDVLAAGPPRDAAALARELDVDADALHRVLRVAALLDVVRVDRRGRFRPGRLGRPLAEGGLRPWARYMGLRSTSAAWAGLADAIRTGEDPFPAANGTSVWSYFAEHPEEERLFAAAMRTLTELDGPFVVGGWDWPSEGVVCDVAGGVGTLLAAVLRERPGLRGVLVDAPGVLREADGFLRRQGLRDRVELVEGDLFAGGYEAEAADVVVLKDVLHDWDDERCATLLGHVRRAVRAGAEVVLVETLQEPNRPDLRASVTDLQMLTQCDGGRQRSVAELHGLLRAAGFAPARVVRTGGPALVGATAV